MPRVKSPSLAPAGARWLARRTSQTDSAEAQATRVQRASAELVLSDSESEPCHGARARVLAHEGELAVGLLRSGQKWLDRSGLTAH